MEELKNGNKVLNPISRILGDALCYPCDAPNLLLLEFEVAVEGSELELLQERLLVKMDLINKESILQFCTNTAVFKLTKQMSGAPVGILRYAGTGGVEELTPHRRSRDPQR